MILSALIDRHSTQQQAPSAQTSDSLLGAGSMALINADLHYIRHPSRCRASTVAARARSLINQRSMRLTFSLCLLLDS